MATENTANRVSLEASNDTVSVEAPAFVPSACPFGSFKLGPADANLEPTNINVPQGLHFQASLKQAGVPQSRTPIPPKPFEKLIGTFVGTGFNTIFRPRNKNSVDLPATTILGSPDDNTLELNLTTEQLTFLQPLGDVPNRGAIEQPDINLLGVPYTQIIKDATNIATGKGDLPEEKQLTIHFETGMLMLVPSSAAQPQNQILRLANIPHGASIQARGPATPIVTNNQKPNIPPQTITPFVIGGGALPPGTFKAQEVGEANRPRLPQDLTKFSNTKAIDQDVLTDPNTILRRSNEGKTFIDVTSFSFAASDTDKDIMNIPFLRGDPSKTAAENANTSKVGATFWISTVEHEISIPGWKPGQPPLPILTPANTGNKTPLFRIVSNKEFGPQKIKVRSTQVQYSQLVILDFANLSWPHVSVATLVPAAPIEVKI